MPNLRQAARDKLRAWAARRHGRDSLPYVVNRRRIYILPTRAGLMLAAVLAAMLLAGLNYNSNLGLALAFLMAAMALVTMHHCNRNMISLQVDTAGESDAFADEAAIFTFTLRNDSDVARLDVEVRCLGASGLCSVAARSTVSVQVKVHAPRRGVLGADQFELRTRYPFGWFHAWTYVQAELMAYVAPAPRGERALPAVSGNGTDGSRSQVRGDEDFAGLRSYEPGMPLKHMAWKALARGAEPAVRSYSGTSAQPEWLDWALLDGRDSEARLAQLCLWVLMSDAAGRRYGLKIPGREVAPARGPAHRRECLRALAVFGLEAP
jgi:uncharacterized protein (DUF58 family)